MYERFATDRVRRAFTATLTVGCLALSSAGQALAQAPLPDPNQPASSGKSAATKPAQKSDLPTTGVETSWLVLTGVALLATGVAIRPAARRRRTYSTDAWQQAVRSRS